MMRIVHCTCGVDLRSSDERDLIERTQRHASEAHQLALTDEQVRAMMEIDQQKEPRT